MLVSLLVRLWVEIIELKSSQKMLTCQPPREAVSWNAMVLERPMIHTVSLLVRLWVEIEKLTANTRQLRVSLLVRLWVEIDLNGGWLQILLCQPPREAVSWNEHNYKGCKQYGSQPPREAVSWNDRPLFLQIQVHVSLLVRLWVEIKYLHHNWIAKMMSASSWGCELK